MNLCIDPGAGSMLLTILIGILGAMGVFFPQRSDESEVYLLTEPYSRICSITG